MGTMASALVHELNQPLTALPWWQRALGGLGLLARKACDKNRNYATKHYCRHGSGNFACD